MPLPRRYLAPCWLAALVVAGVPFAGAQMHHVDAPQRVTRALGVYEWTGDLNKPTAARFVPVSLFIDGHLEDAGLYLARPVPFALQSGDVYSLERAGQPAGLLDLDFARRIVTGNALANDNPEGAWYGFGKFTLETPPKATPLRASRHPASIQTSAGPNTPAGTRLPADDTEDNRPHMSRRDATSGTGSTSTSTSQTGNPPAAGSSGRTDSTPAKTDPPASTTSTTSTSDNDDLDRPTLRKRDPSQDAARRREYGSKSKTSGVTAAGPALGDDPDRPTLSRGSTAEAGTPELTGVPADLHQAVAVSDAAHRDAHIFARDWDSPAERSETLAAMAALAKPVVAAYLTVNHLVPSSAPIPVAPAAPSTPGGAAVPGTAAAGTPAATGQATAPVPAAPSIASDTSAPPTLQRGVPQQYQHPASSAAANTPATAAKPNTSAVKTPATTKSTPTTAKTASGTAAHPTPAARRSTHPAIRSAAVHPVPLTLSQGEISGFTLSYGGLPTFVYTAATSVASGPGSSASAAGSSSGAAVAYVTVVAQRLPTGELQVAMNNVTDSLHLDRGPRLRLIDAVDPDDSHRASLLFELRGGSSRQFALYRLTAVHAEQTFTTASIE